MKIYWILSILIYFHYVVPVYGQNGVSTKVQGIVIHADDMLRDDEQQTIELKGNVQIIFNNQHLMADEAKINLRTKKIHSSGKVEIVSSANTAGGKMAIIDYENNTGVLYQGFVLAGTVLFEGEVLHKTSDTEYLSTESTYTACTNCPASWSFKGSQIKADIGGYAYIKNSVLKVASVPVFWLPYLVVPLKSDRQTGLLTPEIEHSGLGGLTISQPVYWAISRSSDLTYTFKRYEFRGIKSLFNYRYVLSEKSSGNLDFAFLDDSIFKNDDRLNTFRSQEEKNNSINRWFIRYLHYHETPDEIVSRAQINLTSDLQYPKDFSTETLNHGDSAQENRISFTKNFYDKHISVDSSYYINLIRSNPLSDQDDSVHRLPELRYSQMLKPIANSSFFYNLDMDYSNFIRNGKAYDDLESYTDSNNNNYRIIKNGCNSPTYDQLPNNACKLVNDGSFNESTDLIRTGQRFNIQSTIFRPIQVTNGIEVAPKLSYKESRYIFPIPNYPQTTRRYIRTEIASKATFIGFFGNEKIKDQSILKHEIIPEVTYTSTPKIDHTSHPFYGYGTQRDSPVYAKNNLSDADIGSDFGAQFDYNDRILDRNLITFGITNKLTEKYFVNNEAFYRQIALIKIYQSYDAYQASLSESINEPYSDVTALINLKFNQFQSYSVLNYFPYHNVTNISTRLRYDSELGNFLQLALTKQYNVIPGKDVVNANRTEDYELAGGYKVKYLKLLGKIVYNGNNDVSVSSRIKSWAYGMQLIPPGDCWFITLTQEKVAGSDDPVSRLNFSFIFDGKTPPVDIPSMSY